VVNCNFVFAAFVIYNKGVALNLGIAFNQVVFSSFVVLSSGVLHNVGTVSYTGVWNGVCLSLSCLASERSSIRGNPSYDTCHELCRSIRYLVWVVVFSAFMDDPARVMIRSRLRF